MSSLLLLFIFIVKNAIGREKTTISTSSPFRKFKRLRMANVTWDEIQSLRADFANLQLSQTTNKLSERNCVELIGLLVKEGLLNVIYTTDGKDIITEQRLIREIIDEIYANGGRINIVDLAQRLKIDLSYIEGKIGDVCKEDSTLQFTLGQFISAEYTNRLVEEINDILSERGLMSMSDLIRQFDLPTDYLQNLVHQRIIGPSSLNNVKFESSTLYTDNYVRLQQNILLGYLQAALLPVRVNELLRSGRINENLVQNLILSLIRDRRIDGNLLGTSKENSIFYPKVYTDAQAKYIESFFNQNGYIEYSLVRNLGITDPEGQTKIVLKDRPKILFLTSGCVDLMTFLPQLEINIEQNLLATEFVDLTSLMPNSFDENDLERLIKSEASIKQLIETVGAEFLSNTFLLAKELKTKIETKLNEICRDFAEKEFARCTPQLYAAVIQGTLSVANPTATTKKVAAPTKRSKGASKVVEESSSTNETIPFLTKDEMKREISAMNDELPSEIVDLLTDNLYGSKSRFYLDVFVQRVKESFVAKDSTETTTTDAGATRKNELKNVQETMKQIHENICLFSRSIESLNEEKETNLTEALQRHLIRSLCSELCDLFIREVESSASGKTGPLTIEERNKILQKIPEPNRSFLTKINDSLNGKDVETTLSRLEDAANALIQLPLKRPNKKNEKNLALEIREKLKTKLNDEKDSAMILHLTVTLIFYSVHQGQMVHAPGKAVPLLITYLSKVLPKEIHQRLVEMQDFVIQQSSGNATALLDDDKIDFIKRLGLNAKENLNFSSLIPK